MRRGIVFILIFILLLVAPSAVRYLQYYQLGGESREAPPKYDVSKVDEVPIPETTEFVDEPQIGDGLILLDMAHNNQFTMDEIGYFDSRLSQRGFEFIPFTGGDLSTALRSVNAFVVMTPLLNFDVNEVQAVSDFVERGGRLLLVGDPTRFEIVFEETEFTFEVFVETDKIPLNSLANEFDVTFNGDYLYNVTENEGNFRNILVKQAGFAESDLTNGLEQVAFYGAHSVLVGPTAVPLLNGDENTASSATDRPGGLSLAATSREGRVLALGDIQFMIAPYYTVYDNGRFISQIADFLTATDERDYILTDFPYYFGDEISLVYTGEPELGPDAFDEIITLQDAFRETGKSLFLTGEAMDEQDTIYLGLFNQASEVIDMLDAAGIDLLIDPPIEVDEPEADDATNEEEDSDAEEVAEEVEESDEDSDPDSEGESEEDSDIVRLIQSQFGSVQMSGTSLILLEEENGRFNTIVLAASKEGLENTVDRLLQLIPINGENALNGCLVQGNLALCPTDVFEEEVEPELLTGGASEDSVDEEDNTGDDEEISEPDVELDAVNQGTIDLGDSVDGEMLEGENHAWTFNSGPATIDILLESGDDFDAILELYDPTNELITSSDVTFTGENEEILGADIADDGDYTIVVRDFYADGGNYTLTVTEGEPVEGEAPIEIAEPAEDGIFIFSDDDGFPNNEGITSATELADLLSPNYAVTTWISTLDGPLTDELLEGYQLVIWDSGDYADEDGFLGEDTGVILNYIDNGGDIFITGSTPALFNTFETEPISSLQVNGDDPVLLAGFEDGQIIELSQTYDAVISDFFIEDLEEGSVAFLLRGGDSEGAGSVVGLVAPEDEFNPQNTAILLFPFVAMPTDVQATLLENIMNWFEFVQQEG